MQRFCTIFVAYVLIFSNEAADLTCPQSPITSKTPSGKFPSNGISVFPANYDCAVEFQISDGQVIKFITQTNAIPGSDDSLLIRDSVSTLYDMSGVGESILFAPANNSKLWISTKTATSSFCFQWEYIDVTNFQKLQRRTGTILPLNLTQGSYYQFTSILSPVTFHTATLDRNTDFSLSKIHVYDGEDLNSRYIGNLFQFLETKNLSASTGKSLILVNYYGSNTKSWGIANDYSAVYAYNSYSLFVLSKGIDYSGHIVVPNGLESAVTFFCVDSQESYITNLLLTDQKNGAQAVRFKPLTPTHVYTNILVYNIGDLIPQSLPQQILSSTFTMVMYQCDVHSGLFPGPFYIWTLAYPGRTGTIVSPSVWNPTTLAFAPFFTNFTSAEKVKFVFNLISVVVDPGEKIRIEIGSDDTKPVFVEFNETAVNTGTKAAYGTYMATSFTGAGPVSQFRMIFNVEGNATSTTVGVETTTKSSNIRRCALQNGDPVFTKTSNLTDWSQLFILAHMG